MTKSRISTGFRALDGLLGGGLVPGSGYVFVSAPGLGKTTLLLQLLAAAARVGHECLFASIEQTADDLASFVQRALGPESGVRLLGSDGDAYKLVEEAERTNAKVLALDSLQTAFVDDVQADVGSAEQQKAVLNYLTSFAAARNAVVLFVAHLDRDGQLSSDWRVEALANHLGGTTCRIEMPRCTCGAAEGLHHLRIVTADRNKYGPPGRRAVLAMTEHGFSDGLLV